MRGPTADTECRKQFQPDTVLCACVFAVDSSGHGDRPFEHALVLALLEAINLTAVRACVLVGRAATGRQAY